APTTLIGNIGLIPMTRNTRRTHHLVIRRATNLIGSWTRRSGRSTRGVGVPAMSYGALGLRAWQGRERSSRKGNRLQRQARGSNRKSVNGAGVVQHQGAATRAALADGDGSARTN